MAKLATRLEDKQDSGAVILLLHSLGNTGSRAAVRVLLQYLKEEDLDVQMTAVSSLRMHLSSEEVQQALVEVLEETIQEEVGLAHRQQHSPWCPCSMASPNLCVLFIMCDCQ